MQSLCSPCVCRRGCANMALRVTHYCRVNPRLKHTHANTHTLTLPHHCTVTGKTVSNLCLKFLTVRVYFKQTFCQKFSLKSWVRIFEKIFLLCLCSIVRCEVFTQRPGASSKLSCLELLSYKRKCEQIMTFTDLIGCKQ